MKLLLNPRKHQTFSGRACSPLEYEGSQRSLIKYHRRALAIAVFFPVTIRLRELIYKPNIYDSQPIFIL